MKSILSKLQTSRPWNKGKLIGQEAPLNAQEIWSTRMRLQGEGRERDLALFNLAIDSKLRACDLLQIKFSDLSTGSRIYNRASICQQKTSRPVRFELTPRTRKSIKAWIKKLQPKFGDYLFPSGATVTGHTNLGSTVRYLGIEIDDALELSEQTDV